MATSPSDKSVVGVCGAQARVYGPIDPKTNIRPLRQVINFPHRGAALDFAHDHEDETPRNRAR